ncbi:MAG TPA: TlpA family protein disulfide reductase [Campylobacterales bacterium]|nr:TlpA family protein disulfide reductase [Campylobacterales bacterium]
MKKHTQNRTQNLLNKIIILLIVTTLLLFGFYFYMNNKTQHNIIPNEPTDKQYTKLKSNNNELYPNLISTFNLKTIKNKNITINTDNGKFKIDGLKDKLVFLKVFGWDCNFCIKEIPELVKLKDNLGDTFEIIAIEAQQHSQKASLEYIEKYKINYDIILGNDYQSFYSYLKIYYGWSGIIPLTIVLGKDGTILAFELGVKSYTLAELMKASIEREKNRE